MTTAPCLNLSSRVPMFKSTCLPFRPRHPSHETSQQLPQNYCYALSYPCCWITTSGVLSSVRPHRPCILVEPASTLSACSVLSTTHLRVLLLHSPLRSMPSKHPCRTMPKYHYDVLLLTIGPCALDCLSIIRHLASLHPPERSISFMQASAS